MAAGGGELVADFEFPEPDPAPVTTIAWRLGHVIVGIFGVRNAARRPSDRLPDGDLAAGRRPRPGIARQRLPDMGVGRTSTG